MSRRNHKRRGRNSKNYERSTIWTMHVPFISTIPRNFKECCESSLIDKETDILDRSIEVNIKEYLPET
jgi:hypothetical protein